MPASPATIEDDDINDDDAGPALSAALEAALLRELVRAWREVNATYFKNALQPPQLVLARGRARLGQWIRDARVIELSRPLVLTQPWASVIEVLKHEMAHQYVHEVLGRTDETAHGPAFRSTCERMGIDAAASGMPKAPRDDAYDPRRAWWSDIARLLALAESPNEHEAQAAMSAAQRLMLKHNIEAASDPERRNYTTAHLGRASGRVTEAERILGGLLGKHFFVEVIWVPVYRPLDGKRGSVLEASGTRANVAMAEYVHGFLTHTGESLWSTHKRELRRPSRSRPARLPRRRDDGLRREARTRDAEARDRGPRV